MAKHPNSIKNPLPNGKETHSKHRYYNGNFWIQSDGYDYHNELKTIRLFLELMRKVHTA